MHTSLYEELKNYKGKKVTVFMPVMAKSARGILKTVTPHYLIVDMGEHGPAVINAEHFCCLTLVKEEAPKPPVKKSWLSFLD